ETGCPYSCARRDRVAGGLWTSMAETYSREPDTGTSVSNRRYDHTTLDRIYAKGSAELPKLMAPWARLSEICHQAGRAFHCFQDMSVRAHVAPMYHTPSFQYDSWLVSRFCIDRGGCSWGEAYATTSSERQPIYLT